MSYSYLSLSNKKIMLMIWTTIMRYRYHYWENEDNNQTKAFRRWQQTVYNRTESQIVQILRDTAWLPDIDGNYRKPSEVSPDSLDKDFHIDSDSPFLDAIEFGKEESERRRQLEEEERHRTTEYQTKSNAAKILGLNDMAEFEEMQRKAELYARADAEGRIMPETQIEEPTATTNNPEKRTTAATETTTNASDRTYEQKTRSVRTSQTKIEATTMLRRLYTNHDDKMICQCCGKELPFKKKNGEYYFVTIELDNPGGEFFSKETIYPYIACCPNCAAMFNEHIIHCNSDENRIADLLNIIESDMTIKNPNGNEVIEIIMDGKIFNLTFVQKHIIDIRAAIKAQKS